MARNGSGTYSNPLADVVTGAVIEAAWANTTVDDLGTEITDSLSRSGKGNMSVALKVVSGTVGAPGLTFVSETNGGLYRSAAGDLRFSMGAADYWRVTSAGFQMYVSATWVSPLINAAQTVTGVQTFSADPIIPDEVYGAGWNGSLEPATKNALYDKIETIVAGGSFVSDTVYGASWNGDTTIAPSKNAVYDKIESVVAAAGTVSDTVYGVGWDGDTTIAPSKNAVYDKLELIIADYVPDTGDSTIAGIKTFSSDPLIPDEAYGVGWNGVLEPPTKNAVYDQVELKANIASPTLTGTPAAPTAAAGTTTTQIATTAFVRTPGVQSVASSATVTPTAADDLVIITAQAEALTLANPSGSPVQGQKLVVRIKDNATARAITFGSEYRALGQTLPTTTVISKTMYLGFIRNTTDTKWDLVAKAEQA